jgi:hypothetical protein
MKWVFAIGERHRLALCLTVIFVISLLATYFIQKDVAAADRSVRSLYKDRLVPAQDIAFVQERLYQNELLLQDHINASTTATYPQIENEIRQHSTGMDSLVNKFAHTILVDKEVESLKAYRSYLPAHRRTQQQILWLSVHGRKQEAATLYRSDGQRHFKQLMGTVQQLASLQTSVGYKLYDQSHQDLLEAGLLTYLVIGLTLVVGLLAQVLLKWSLLASRLPYKPTLN